MDALRTAQVSTADVEKSCAKCHTAVPPIFRHHKGCDGYLGHFNKGILGNYKKYLDCVHLCFECHCTVHYIYERWLQNWVNRTPLGAKKMRKILIGVCDDWLAGRIKTPQVPTAYKTNFRRSHAEWLRTVEKLGTG